VTLSWQHRTNVAREKTTFALRWYKKHPEFLKIPNRPFLRIFPLSCRHTAFWVKIRAFGSTDLPLMFQICSCIAAYQRKSPVNVMYGVVYNFGRVCLSDDNFRKPWHIKFIFTHAVHLHGIRAKFEFVYECDRVKVKVTRAKRVQNLNSRNVKLRSPIIPLL